MWLTRAYAKDIALRMVWTFVQTFAGVFVVADLGTVEEALTASIAAVLSVLKSVASTQLGRTPGGEQLRTE